MATTDTLAHSSRWPGWPDARGWIGLGSFVLTILVLLLIWRDPDLRKDEFFKTIATLIIGTGWVNGVLAWAYSATKQGGELSAQNAAIVRKQASVGQAIDGTDA